MQENSCAIVPQLFSRLAERVPTEFFETMLLKISGVCLVALGMLCLLPSSLSVQGTIRITSVYGPVEHKTSIATGFVPFSASSLLVNVGDRVRTGPGGNPTLELPDGIFMIVHQNSVMTTQEPGAPSLRNLLM